MITINPQNLLPRASSSPARPATPPDRSRQSVERASITAVDLLTLSLSAYFLWTTIFRVIFTWCRRYLLTRRQESRELSGISRRQQAALDPQRVYKRSECQRRLVSHLVNVNFAKLPNIFFAIDRPLGTTRALHFHTPFTPRKVGRGNFAFGALSRSRSRGEARLQTCRSPGSTECHRFSFRRGKCRGKLLSNLCFRRMKKIRDLMVKYFQCAVGERGQ